MDEQQNEVVIDAQHPWPWLDAYTTKASKFFNGRDNDTEALLRCVLSSTATVFFGKSGLGKTSLLQAGLSGALKKRQLFAVMVRLRGSLNEGDFSLVLHKALLQAAHAEDLIWTGPPSESNAASKVVQLWELLHERDGQFKDTTGRAWVPVFVLDQFEEVFTLVPEGVQRQAIFAELGNLIESRLPREVAERLDATDELYDRIDPDRTAARFVVTLREDYLPDLEPWADAIPRLGPNRYRLLPMSKADALEAIAKTGGTLVDHTDAECIIKYLDEHPPDAERVHHRHLERIEPTLLSLVCAGLNQYRIDLRMARLDTKSLNLLGQKIIEQFYDRAILALHSKRRDTAARFIENELITADGTRRPFPERSLARVGISSGDVAVLKEHRLLRAENTEHGAYIELVHDRIGIIAAARANRRRERDTERRRNLWLLMTLSSVSILLAGLIAVIYQWHLVKAAANNATARWLLTDESAALTAGNQSITGVQRLLMTLAGYRIAQASKAQVVQYSGDVALQRATIRLRYLKWLKDANSRILAIAVSPDGTRIASGNMDGILQLWDQKSGAPIGPPIKGHKYWASGVAFSPDSSRFVSSSYDHTLRLWDTKSGKQVGLPLEGHLSEVLSVAFSPDGTHIVSGSADNTLRLWDAQSGAPIGSAIVGHSNWVSSVAFSQDGTRIASSSYDQTLRLWDAKTLQPIGSPYTGHTSAILSVAFSPDNLHIVSGGADATIRLWNARTGTQVGAPFAAHSKAVNSVAFSPDGLKILSGSSDNTILVWDVRFGTPISEPLMGHSAPISSVAFTRNGLNIVSGSEDNTLRYWDIMPETFASNTIINQQPENITSVALNPDNSRIVSSSKDNTLRVWDAISGAPIGQPLRGHSSPVLSVAISPDNLHIASGSSDNTIRIWSMQTGEPIDPPLKGHSDAILSIAISPDSTRIASGSSDKTIRIWDTRSHDALGKPLVGHTDGVTSIAFSPDGSRIVSGSRDNTLRVWNAKSGVALGRAFAGHGNWVNSVAFSPDGSLIVSGSRDTTLRVWNASSGATLGQPLEGHLNWITSVAFSPDGSRIVSGSRDNTLRLWDVSTGTPIGMPLKGHLNWVTSVAFSSDGAKIISGSNDNTLRSWPVLRGWADQLCAKLPRNMSHKEWHEWVSPEIDYIAQCPNKPILRD